MGDCKGNLKYEGGHGWKYGPWGEDLFQQRCLDRHGVEKLPGYGLSNSGTCPMIRPKSEKDNTKYIPKCAGATQAVVHPFRDVKSYFDCLAATKNAGSISLVCAHSPRQAATT